MDARWYTLDPKGLAVLTFALIPHGPDGFARTYY